MSVLALHRRLRVAIQLHAAVLRFVPPKSQALCQQQPL